MDGTESIGKKSNISDDCSVRSERTCETELTDTLSTSLDQRNMNNLKTDIIEQNEEHEQVRVKRQMIDVTHGHNLKREYTAYRESHINSSFHVSLGLVGGSGQSQGKAFDVRYGTRHPTRPTMEISI